MMATANETGICSGLVAGLDVAKARLDATAGGAGVCSFANDAEGIAALLEWLAARNVGLVVDEPTGGYEEPLVQSLRRAGIPVHLAHPNRVRAFAQASGQLAKTDRLDAQALSRYGEVFVSPGFPSRRRNRRGRNCRRCSGGAGDWWTRGCRNATVWTGPETRESTPPPSGISTGWTRRLPPWTGSIASLWKAAGNWPAGRSCTAAFRGSGN